MFVIYVGFIFLPASEFPKSSGMAFGTPIDLLEVGDGVLGCEFLGAGFISLAFCNGGVKVGKTAGDLPVGFVEEPGFGSVGDAGYEMRGQDDNGDGFSDGLPAPGRLNEFTDHDIFPYSLEAWVAVHAGFWVALVVEWMGVGSKAHLGTPNDLVIFKVVSVWDLWCEGDPEDIGILEFGV